MKSGPTQPMRCGVCGFRVYKSYRYISRSNAPAHLKNFFEPETERFRVCKRCYSSKERCRQNLSLILLKSQTEQYTHLRSPLGTTHHRRSHSMKFLTRDIGRSLKRPYEDLICEETLDEDYLSDGDDVLVKAMKKEPISAKASSGNNTIDKTTGTGVVTVVRPVRNAFEVYPNHFTIYGEITKTTEEGNTNAKTELTTIKIFNKKPEEKSLESDVENSPENANGELKTEIRNINYKLTLLDHAYALPAAKNVKFTKPMKPVIAKVPKIIKTDSLAKAAIKNMIKNNNQIKKKEAGSSGENKEPAPARTCGIICSLCSNLVTKSYSCYRKDNAPENLRVHFTGDRKVIKVCRRCVPYKKPKTEDNSSKAAKSKVSMNKFLKQKVKHARKAAKLDVKQIKSEISTQTKDVAKTPEKPPKDDNNTKEVKTVPEIHKEPTITQVSPKQDNTMVHVSIKNGKVESSTTSDTLRSTFPPIATTKDTESKPTSNKSPGTVFNSQGEVIANMQLQSSSMIFLKLKGIDALTSKQQPVTNVATSVDFGTQPIQSMIGVKKTKPKPVKKESESELKTDEQLLPEEKPATENSEESDKKIESEKENEKEAKQEERTCDKKEDLIVDDKQAKEHEIEKALQKAMNDAVASKPEIKPSKLVVKAPLTEPVRSSPRRDKHIVAPEKKKDTTTETKTPTVVTRKRRGISESDSESIKQSDDKCRPKQNDATTDSKQSDEKTIDKAEATLKRSMRKGRGMKRKDSECSSTSSLDTTDKKDGKKTKTDADGK
ncbi:hypothetical protein QZH41_016520, partial [Actinostola sp. cb2023]